jgi:hypothetical protein
VRFRLPCPFCHRGTVVTFLHLRALLADRRLKIGTVEPCTACGRTPADLDEPEAPFRGRWTPPIPSVEETR